MEEMSRCRWLVGAVALSGTIAVGVVTSATGEAYWVSGAANAQLVSQKLLGRL